MARSEFEGPPLIAGTLLGTRHFAIRYDGALTGPTYPVEWGPGENLAVHRMAYWGDFNLPPQDHPVAKSGCTCGFYAYYDIGDSPYGKAGHEPVHPAIIEAYGRVSVGPRGFRAAKARIIAISSQAPEPPWFEVAEEPAHFTGLVSRHYPDVKVYASTERMLAEHPTPRPSGLVDPGPKVEETIKNVITVSAGWCAPSSTIYALAGGMQRIATATVDAAQTFAGFTSTEEDKPVSRLKIEYHYRDNPPPKPGWVQVSPSVHRYIPRKSQRGS